MEKFKLLTATLAAGVNTHTFTDPIINDNSVIEVYTTDDEIYPTDLTQSGNNLYVTILNHTESIGVAVTINNVETFSQPILATDIQEDNRHRFVTDLEKQVWNSKADRSDISSLTNSITTLNRDVTLLQGSDAIQNNNLSTLNTAVTGLNQSFTQYKDDGYLPKNLFDKNSVILGYYNTDGSTGSDGNWSRTVIKVKPNTPYTISGCSSATSHCFVELDSNQSFISSIVRGNKTITTSTNTHYLGISSVSNKALTNHDIDTLQIEEGTEATAYTPYAMPNTELTGIIDDAIEDGYIGTNRFDVNAFSQKGTSISISNDNIVFTNSNYNAIRYSIPLKSGTYTFGYTVAISNGRSYVDAKVGSTSLFESVKTASGTYAETFTLASDSVVDLALAGASATSSGTFSKIMLGIGTDASYQPYIPSNTELKKSLSQLIKKATFTITTDSAGALVSGISINNPIIALVPKVNMAIATPYFRTGSNFWGIKVTNSSGQSLANTTLEIDAYYI